MHMHMVSAIARMSMYGVHVWRMAGGGWRVSYLICVDWVGKRPGMRMMLDLLQQHPTYRTYARRVLVLQLRGTGWLSGRAGGRARRQALVTAGCFVEPPAVAVGGQRHLLDHRLMMVTIRMLLIHE